MGKARTLANLISDNAELADGQISVAEVVGAAPTASPTFTGTVNADAITMSGFLTVNGGADFNTVLYPDGIAMADSRTISFGTSADFELNGGSTFLDFNLKDNARHLRIKNGLVEHHRFSGNGSVIFNESGADADFRIESNSNEHMLFVDGGNNSVGIGTGNPVASGQSTITIGTRTIVGKTVENQSLFSDNAYFTGSMWTTKETDSWASIRTNNNSIRFHTGGTHTAGTSLTAMDSTTMRLYISDSEVVFNNDSQDTDFRVESDNQANMLKVDAGNDSVAINRSNGSAPLHVSGDPNDTVAPEHAYAKFTAQGLDGLAFGSFASGTYASWIQSGYTSNTYSPDWNNGYAMLLNPAGGNVGIRDTAPQVDLHVGGGGHIRSDVVGGKIGWGSGASAPWYSYMQSTDDGAQNVGLQFLTTTNAGTSHYQMLRMYPDSGSVFNPDRGGVIDFRVASGSNNHALFVDSGQDSVNIGTSSTNPPNGARFRAINHDTYLEINHASGTSSGAVFMDFRYSQANIGKITQNGTSQVLYVTTSDSRLKENIADADDAGSKIDAIQVRKYDWKVDGSHQKYGMIAQELLEVAPEAVSVSEDPDEMMGVDYSKLVPMLIKEIQSLRLRVADLES